MDTLLQLGWEVTTSFIDDYVSILVLMDTLLQLNGGQPQQNNVMGVSILVLMDTLLQPRIFNKILYLSVLQRFFQTLKSHFFA